MKLAIHNSTTGFHPRWVAYCKEQKIPFKLVNCYSNDLVLQLEDCDALVWHHSHSTSSDILVARKILSALEHTGLKVFPDFKTGWHFDDKIAQKYLLERIGIPMVPSYVFYDKKTAMEWVSNSKFPIVFKLRGGAGSKNVRLIKCKKEAFKIVNRSFSRGFKQYDSLRNLKDRIYKYKEGKTSIKNVLKGVIRLGYKPKFSRVIGKEREYVYFQEFLPNNNFDIRIIIIGDKAFGLKRMVRKGDFRASGSGEFKFAKEEFDARCVEIAFEANRIIQSQSIAYDFVFDHRKNPLIVEISYGFSPEAYDNCPGYWDEELNWHSGKFNPEGWMIENLIHDID